MKSKAWTPFAAIGFVTNLVTTMDMLQADLRITAPLTLSGLVTALLGFGGVAYTGLVLSRHASRQRDTFIADGIYRVVRHPLYLSGIIWNVGMVLLALSTCGLSQLVTAAGGIASFWLASKTEDGYNIARFGPDYEQYVQEVPGLNFVKGWRNLE